MTSSATSVRIAATGASNMPTYPRGWLGWLPSTRDFVSASNPRSAVGAKTHCDEGLLKYRATPTIGLNLTLSRKPKLDLTVSDAPRDPTSRRAVHPGRFARRSQRAPCCRTSRVPWPLASTER